MTRVPCGRACYLLRPDPRGPALCGPCALQAGVGMARLGRRRGKAVSREELQPGCHLSGTAASQAGWGRPAYLWLHVLLGKRPQA